MKSDWKDRYGEICLFMAQLPDEPAAYDPLRHLADYEAGDRSLQVCVFSKLGTADGWIYGGIREALTQEKGAREALETLELYPPKRYHLSVKSNHAIVYEFETSRDAVLFKLFYSDTSDLPDPADWIDSATK